MKILTALITNILVYAMMISPMSNLKAFTLVDIITRHTIVDSIPRSTIKIADGDTIESFQVPTKDQLKHLPKIWHEPVSAKELAEWEIDVVKSEDGKLAWWSDDPGGEKYGTIKIDDCIAVVPIYVRTSKNKSLLRLMIKCEEINKGFVRSDASRKIPHK